MKGNGLDTRKIPISGIAGEAIYAALLHMSTFCGEYDLTIKKERVAGGGYVYTLSTHEPAAIPQVRSMNHGN